MIPILTCLLIRYIQTEATFSIEKFKILVNRQCIIACIYIWMSLSYDVQLLKERLYVL